MIQFRKETKHTASLVHYLDLNNFRGVVRGLEQYAVTSVLLSGAGMVDVALDSHGMEQLMIWKYKTPFDSFTAWTARKHSHRQILQLRFPSLQ